MKIISHRGNLVGPKSCQENAPLSINKAIELGFDCEIDLWVDNSIRFLLGHDFGEFEVKFNWLKERQEKLWIHCKNLKALEILQSDAKDLNFFWHQNDDHVLTSKAIIWSFPGKPISSQAIAVLPEIWDSYESESLKDSYGICTDYPLKFDQSLNGSTLS